ncbi:MAG: methyltransferase [Acidimicrobiales bacterium]
MRSKTSTSTPRSLSPDPDETAIEDLFLTRTADFAFHRQRLHFELARTVFASAGVDPGSALLLRHLQAVGLTGGERVLDVGAGHGTLGIVLAALDRSRSVTFVDRDSLACAFTVRNLAGNGLPVATDGTEPQAGEAIVRGSLGYDGVAGATPFDLVVSNIPGKAGENVIEDLVTGAAAVARAGAVVGFVVVKPLAEELEELVAAPMFEPVLTTGNKTHVVVIARVGESTVPRGSDMKSGSGERPLPVGGFERGLYDRAAGRFSSGLLEWSATTVTGLDEFDTLSQATRLLRGALQGVRATPSVVANPGQGHRAVIAALAGYQPSAIVGRDLLALSATRRCLADNDCGDAPELVHDLSVPEEWFYRVPLVILHADDKVHGPWFTAEVIRYLDYVDRAGSGRHNLVLTGRSGLLGRLEADVLRRRKGHVAYKKGVKGYRAIRFTSS